VRIASAPSLDEMRARFDTDLAALPAATRLLRDAVPVEVHPSEALVGLTSSTRDEALRRSGADDGSR
jgi:hypothetical protein